MKLNYILLLILVYLYTLPRYVSYLPTFPIYDNNEAKIVLEKWQNRTTQDVKFFNLTDPSIVYAFLDYVKEEKKELINIITSPKVMYIIRFLKYIINRPRPYQIESKIKPLHSDTGYTPALPAGHAFQAYYLAHVLSKRYPEKKDVFDNIAARCDDVRVKGGIHYPSDGLLSKNIVYYMISIKVY